MIHEIVVLVSSFSCIPNACCGFPTSDFSRIVVDRKWMAYSGDSGMVISNKKYIAHNLNKMLFVNMPPRDTSSCEHLKILCGSMNLCSCAGCLWVFLGSKLNNLHTGLPEPFSNHNRQPWRVYDSIYRQKNELWHWSRNSQVCLNMEVLLTLVLVSSTNIKVLTAYNMGLFGVSTSHEWSQVTGLVWSILFANLIGKVVLYQYYSVTVSLWHCTITQAIFNIPILCHMLSENIWLYHSKVYLRYASGQSLRNRVTLWQIAKYGEPKEILNPDRNDISLQKWHGCD